MAGQRKIVVVGGGVLGLSCALSLAKRPDIEVTLVEKNHPGSGSSGLAVGMASRQQGDVLGLTIAHRAYQLLEDLEKDFGLNLRRIGYFTLTRTQADVENFQVTAQRQADLGWAESRVVTLDELATICPPYVPPADATGAVWDEHAFYMDGNELCASLAQALRDAGGTLLTRTEFLGLEPSSSGAKYRVATSAGDLEADLLVNATGAWSREVGDRSGAAIPVLNERHEAYIFRVRNNEHALPMMLDFIPGSKMGEGLYFRQEGPDRLIAGMHSSNLLGHDESDIENYSQRLDEDASERVFALLTEVLPELELGFEGGWCGLYPHHPSNGFVLGPHPDNPDIIIGAGLGGRGLGPGVALGEILADWAADGTPTRIPGAVAYAPQPS